MASKDQFAVISLDALSWPSLEIPSRRFRLFVAADSSHGSVGEISRFAEAALSSGMVYLCAWGLGCERFHDIVDEVVVEDELDERRYATLSASDVVITTWHTDETLTDALEFFAKSAVPTDGYAEGSDYRLVICVGNPEWASTAERLLGSTGFLI